LVRRFRSKWLSDGRFVLFVHSDSPIWKDELSRRLFPKIERHTVFLNWSQRSHWKHGTPLEAKLLRHWGGIRDFNPMAIIIPPRGRVRCVRFYKAFRDFKHGNRLALESAEQELLAHIDEARQMIIGSFSL